MAQVLVTLRSTHNWLTAQKGQELADILSSEGGFITSEKFDDHEPEHIDFNASNRQQLLDIWTSDTKWLHTRRRKPHQAWSIAKTVPQGSRRFQELLAGYDEKYFKKKGEDNATRLLNYTKRLYSWGGLAHGYICHEKDWESKNYLGNPVMIGGRPVSFGGMWLEESLPGIYWANLFGPEYVDFFGKERFETTPAFRKEQLPDGGYLIFTSESPLDYGNSEVSQLEEAIIEHLGRDAFFEKINPQKPCRAPQFAFEGSDASSDNVTPFDPIALVIPDTDQFLGDVRKLSRDLGKDMSTKLDLSPQSLEQIDDFILQKASEIPEAWVNAEGQRLLQELTAYYGEVLRRNLKGRWINYGDANGEFRPAIMLNIKGQQQFEHPFTRVARLWLEQERADGLATRYRLIERGELSRLEDSVSNL